MFRGLLIQPTYPGESIAESRVGSSSQAGPPYASFKVNITLAILVTGQGSHSQTIIIATD